MRECYDQSIAPVVAERWAEERSNDSAISERTKEPKAGFRAQVAREVFASLPVDEQKEFSERAKKEAADAKTAYLSTLNSPPPTDAEARQRCIGNLHSFVGPILQGIHGYTGLHATLIVGGPMPSQGGELGTLHFSYGRNKAAVPQHWGQWDKGRFTSNVQNFMVEYLKTAYTAQECADSVLATSSAATLDGARYKISAGAGDDDSDSDSEPGSDSDSDSDSDTDLDEEEAARTRKKRKLEVASAKAKSHSKGKRKANDDDNNHTLGQEAEVLQNKRPKPRLRKKGTDSPRHSQRQATAASTSSAHGLASPPPSTPLMHAAVSPAPADAAPSLPSSSAAPPASLSISATPPATASMSPPPPLSQTPAPLPPVLLPSATPPATASRSPPPLLSQTLVPLPPVLPPLSQAVQVAMTTPP
ncbi:hypothetical protein C8R45DRAFT_960429, partial [Mycena sanguinolenta]